MTAVKLAYALGLPAMVGFLIVTWLSRPEIRQGTFERIFLGFGIGAGMITFEMFIIGLLRIPFQAAVISSLQFATVIAFGYFFHLSGMSWYDILGRRTGQPDHSPGKTRRLKRLVILLVVAWIVAKVLFVISESFFLPVNTSDSLEHWSLSAKFFYYNKGLALDPTNEHYFGADYLKLQRYPLNVPLMQVWTSLCLGEAHEVYMKVWNALLFVSMVGLLFCALRRSTTLTTALLATLFLAGVPLLTYHALTEYADLPLSFYALGGAICFWDIIVHQGSVRDRNARGMLILMGLCMALCTWTKMEGLFFAMAFSAALALYFLMKRIPLSRGIAYIAPLTLVTLPWYVFLFFMRVPISYGEDRMLGDVITKGTVYFQALPVIAEQVLFSANFNIIFPVLFLLVVLGLRSIVRSGLGYLYVALTAVMAMFLTMYLGTESYRWVMNLTAVNRNILTFIPMMYYLAALTAHGLRPGDKDLHPSNAAD